MAKLVSKVYGDALFETAVEKSIVDSLYEEVCSLKAVMNSNPQLLQLLNHPKITGDEKIDVIKNIFSGRISEELTGLLVIIVNKGRYNDILAICEYFIEAVKEYKNIGVAYVTSAVPLSETQMQQMKEKLLATTKYQEIEMNYQVDAALIGGLIIRINDRVVDSSIKTKLYDLSKELSKIQLA